MHHDHGFAGHGGEVLTLFDFRQLREARFQRTERKAMIFRINEAEVAGVRVPLNAPLAKEPHIGPKLPATESFHVVEPKRQLTRSFFVGGFFAAV